MDEKVTKEEIAEMQETLSKVKEISVMSSSKGGKEILKALETDIAMLVTGLSGYAQMTHEQFVTSCAEITTKLNIYGIMSGSANSQKNLQKIIQERYRELD